MNFILDVLTLERLRFIYWCDTINIKHIIIIFGFSMQGSKSEMTVVSRFVDGSSEMTWLPHADLLGYFLTGIQPSVLMN